MDSTSAFHGFVPCLNADYAAAPNTWKDECSAALAGQVPFYRAGVLSWRRSCTGYTLLMTRYGKVESTPIKRWDSDVRYAARKAAIRRARKAATHCARVSP